MNIEAIIAFILGLYVGLEWRAIVGFYAWIFTQDDKWIDFAGW